MASARYVAVGSGRDYTLRFPGLRLTAVSDDLASYFGPGSENGLLVLDASDDWGDLRAGDVILSHNGRSVRRDGGGASLSIDHDESNEFEVLRKGKRMKITVKPR
jgi:S1-C subfamily serine protease